MKTEESIKPIATYTVYDYGDGSNDLKYAMRAQEMHSSIWELLHEVLRPVWKHGQDPVQADHYEAVKDALCRILNENGIGDLF